MPLLVDDIPFEPGPAELIPDLAVTPPALGFELAESADELSAEWAEIVGATGPVLEALERESAAQLTALREISPELDTADRDLGELGDEQEEAELAAMEASLPEGNQVVFRLGNDFAEAGPAEPEPAVPRTPPFGPDFDFDGPGFDSGGFPP